MTEAAESECRALLAELVAGFTHPEMDADCEVTIKDFAEAAGINFDTARRHLDGLVRSGRLTKRLVWERGHAKWAYRRAAR